MQNVKGKIIKATPALNDYFKDAVIFITEHNEKGAAGFVINRLFHRKLNELQEFSFASAIDIYEGGPVDNEHLYFLHTTSLGGEPITDNIYLGGNFNEAVKQLTNGTLSSSEIKIFIGYCGWDAGELEAEIEEGSWNVKSGSLFESEPL